MKSLIVTDSGNELIARVIAGETTISFTRIAVSDCDYSEIDVKQIKDLQQIKQTVPISKISRLDKNMIEVLAAVENRQVEEAYFVYALGIYAKDSNENEILYGVSLCDENPDYMPAYERKVLSGILYRLDIVVGDSEQVLLDVNPAAVATTLQVEQIENDLIRHTQDREIHVTEEEKKKIADIIIPNEIQGTLSAGKTELVLSSEKISADSTIDIYTDVYGVSPKTATVADRSITMTFKAQTKSVQVKVVVK